MPFRRLFKPVIIFAVVGVLLTAALAPSIAGVAVAQAQQQQTPTPQPTPPTPQPTPPASKKAANADADCGWIEFDCWVYTFIASIIAGLTYVIGLLVTFLVGVVIYLGEYNGFIYSPAVVQGWNVVRDIGNMFFVLVLLLISFGTILHLEQYQLKRLLPKVLLMAVLVNFSKAIAGALIDFAQVVMLTFAAAYHEIGAGNFVSALKLQNILTVRSGGTVTIEAVRQWDVFAGYVLALIYVVVAVIVVGAFVAILAARIVMLWILIVLSPMAYVLSIVPAGQKYASQWWDQFAKYVIVGPVMAFFLWLSLATLPNILTKDAGFAGRGVQTFQGSEAGLAGTSTISGGSYLPDVGITEAGSSSQLVGFIISLAMLLAALIFTMQIGGIAGKIAGSAYSRIGRLGVGSLRFAGGVVGWGERKLALATKGRTAFINPFRVARIWRGYSERVRGREEGQIPYLAASAAGESFKHGAGLSGVLRTFAGAQDDAFETYLGFRGIGRLIKTVVTGKTGTKDYDKAMKAKKKMEIEQAYFKADRSGKALIDAGRIAVADEAREAILGPATAKARQGREAYLASVAAGAEDRSLKKYGKRTVLDKEGKPHADRNVADIMQDAGVNPENAEQVEKFYEEWDRERALDDLQEFGGINTMVDARVSGHDEDYLKQRGIEALQKRRDEQKTYVENLRQGGLTKEQTVARDSVVSSMKQQLKKIEDAILTAGDEEKKSLELTRKALQDKLGSKQFTKTGDYYGVTDEEKKQNDVSNERDLQVAEVEFAKIEGHLLGVENEATQQAELAKKSKLMNAYKKESEDYIRAPRPYYAEQAFRILESQESAKLPHEAMEYSELDSLIRQAKDDKNIVQLSALLKKAAKDYNDNEVWNSFGYGSGPQGAEEFRKNHLVKLMGDEASMALMSEINYINEETGHHNVTRSYGVKNGSYYTKTPEEQAAAAAWEVLKRQSRNFLQNSNRLAYGYEDVNGRFHLDLTGKLIIAGLQQDMLYRLGRNEFNPNLLLKLMEDIGTLEEMVRRGVLDPKVVELLRTRGSELARRGVPSSPDGFAQLAGKLG